GSNRGLGYKVEAGGDPSDDGPPAAGEDATEERQGESWCGPAPEGGLEGGGPLARGNEWMRRSLGRRRLGRRRAHGPKWPVQVHRPVLGPAIVALEGDDEAGGLRGQQASQLEMIEFSNNYEGRSGKPAPDTGGPSGTQLVIGIVAMFIGSVFLLGGFVL